MEEFFTNNFRYRKEPVSMIIVHSMGEYIGEKFAPEYLESLRLSSDYYILPNGDIIQGNESPKELYTFHANEIKWDEKTNLNTCSVGIQLLIEGRYHKGSIKEAIKNPQSFTDNHYQSLDMICSQLMKQFPLITTDRILEESMVKDDLESGWDHDRFINGINEKLERKYLKPEVTIDPEDKVSLWDKTKKKLKKCKRIIF